MKKLQKGSVAVFPDGSKFWITNHSKEFVRAENEARLICTHGETFFKDADILTGDEAMKVIKETWY